MRVTPLRQGGVRQHGAPPRFLGTANVQRRPQLWKRCRAKSEPARSPPPDPGAVPSDRPVRPLPPTAPTRETESVIEELRSRGQIGRSQRVARRSPTVADGRREAPLR